MRRSLATMLVERIYDLFSGGSSKKEFWRRRSTCLEPVDGH